MENLSRSIVRYLQHDPTAPVDENAYIEVSLLMKYFHVSYQLQEAVHQPTDKQRLFISSCRKFIRAAAGHSIPVNLTNFAQSIDDPAQVRYCCHGTSLHAYSQIKEEGLKTMTRQYILGMGTNSIIHIRIFVLIFEYIRIFDLVQVKIECPNIGYVRSLFQYYVLKISVPIIVLNIFFSIPLISSFFRHILDEKMNKNLP